MKKFLYLYQGAWEYTDEMKAGWQQWFAEVGNRFVDSGNPFLGGREVTPSGSTALTPQMSPAVGYSIVSAADMDEAERLLEGCPIIESVRIYEAATM
jgi:hypothetical protein